MFNRLLSVITNYEHFAVVSCQRRRDLRGGMVQSFLMNRTLAHDRRMNRQRRVRQLALRTQSRAHRIRHEAP